MESPTTTDFPNARKGVGERVSAIPNPLTFDPATLSGLDVVELGPWRNPLIAESRRPFAKDTCFRCVVVRARTWALPRRLPEQLRIGGE